MGDYTITFARAARKEIENLNATLINTIFPKIEALVNEPRPRGCKKLHGEENLWRIRVGDYRVVYAIYDEKQLIDIIAVRHRSEAYK